MSEAEQPQVAERLRRIDELVAALGHIADPMARGAARALVEAVLDLHGLALARIMATVAAEGGPALSARLAEDEQIRAVLLLYGLHPDDPETRVKKALDGFKSRLDAIGAGVRVTRVTAGAVSVRIIGGAGIEALRREIEEAVIDAAPDLDEIVVETRGQEDAAQTAAMAG